MNYELLSIILSFSDNADKIVLIKIPICRNSHRANSDPDRGHM